MDAKQKEPASRPQLGRYPMNPLLMNSNVQNPCKDSDCHN